MALKSRYAKELINVGTFAFLLGLAYVACYLAIGQPFEYGGPCFATMLIWAAAHVGGVVFGFLHLPPLLGMLLSGMLLKNAFPDAVHPLPKEWSKGFRAVALGTIFLRSGFELDLQVFKKVGPAAVRLLLIPGLIEAFVTGLLAHAVFGMSLLLGFTLGFILKAVGPAVVIQTMFDVQSSGYGVEKGIPSIVVGAASFDDMVALTGYSLFSNLALADGSGGHLVWKMFHGPLDLTLGITAGLLGAVLCSCTAIWNTRLKRQLVTFITSMVLLFTLYHYEFNAGGALSCIVLGLFTSYFWERGIHFFRVPGVLSTGPSSTYGHDVEHMVGRLWRFFAQPLLFGIIGGLMDFKVLDVSTIPLSLGIIAAGISVRMPATFMAMTGAGLNLKERLFMACAWMPKATVQAALAAAPLDMIRQAKRKDLEKEGMEILTTAVFAILVCAPLGVLLIHFSAPYLLVQAPRQQSAEDKEKERARLDEIREDDVSTKSPRPPTSPPPPVTATAMDAHHHATSPDYTSHMVNPLLHYIMGNESGFPNVPSSPSSEAGGSPTGWPSHPESGMRRSATSPATLLSLDKHRHSFTSGTDAISALTSQSAPRDNNSVADQGAASAERGQPLGVAAEAYLRSVERLAEVVEAQTRGGGPETGDAASANNATELLEAVRALRQELLAGAAVEESEEAVETARAFFREAESATSLPQVGAVLHSIQVHVSARAGS